MSNMPTWSVTHNLKLWRCRSGVTTAADFYKGQEKVQVRGGWSGQVGQTELSQLSVVNRTKKAKTSLLLFCADEDLIEPSFCCTTVTAQWEWRWAQGVYLTSEFSTSPCHEASVCPAWIWLVPVDPIDAQLDLHDSLHLFGLLTLWLIVFIFAK